jgi:hypothetical protein
VSTRELLWQVAAGLGAAPRESDDVLQLWLLQLALNLLHHQYRWR